MWVTGRSFNKVFIKYKMIQVAILLKSTSNIQFIAEFGESIIFLKKALQNLYLLFICNIFGKKAFSYFSFFHSSSISIFLLKKGEI